ncbi:hypothetical protein [Ralstonia sp. UBA689]|uniref:hypothetical protein n=1 Tax=Ralstonia sp. UBA689 TaxID=1947373 RepID=UPI0025DB8413|nr:hypothetical protein [Ralstonia sp. UBA689]
MAHILAGTKRRCSELLNGQCVSGSDTSNARQRRQQNLDKSLFHGETLLPQRCNADTLIVPFIYLSEPTCGLARSKTSPAARKHQQRVHYLGSTLAEQVFAELHAINHGTPSRLP